MGSDVVMFGVRYIAAMAILFVVTPFLGGSLTVKGMQLAKLPEIPYRKCVAAFYYATLASFLVLLVASVALRLDAGVWSILRPSIHVATQLLLVPLFLKAFMPPRAFLVIAAASFLTDVVVVILLDVLVGTSA